MCGDNAIEDGKNLNPYLAIQCVLLLISWLIFTSPLILRSTILVCFCSIPVKNRNLFFCIKCEHLSRSESAQVLVRAPKAIPCIAQTRLG